MTEHDMLMELRDELNTCNNVIRDNNTDKVVAYMQHLRGLVNEDFPYKVLSDWLAKYPRQKS